MEQSYSREIKNIPEKLTGHQLVKNSPRFMKPESLLLHSQQPAICSHPEPQQSVPHFPIILLEDQY
jgi:hypothetical protein